MTKRELRLPEWDQLADLEGRVLIPRVDTDNLITLMEKCVETAEDMIAVIERFGSSPSLSHAHAVLGLLGRQLMMRDPGAYVVAEHFWQHLSFKGDTRIIGSLIGSLAYLSARVTPQSQAEKDFVKKMCHLGLQCCETESAAGRLGFAEDLYERIEALLEALEEVDPDLAFSCVEGAQRLRKLLMRYREYE